MDTQPVRDISATEFPEAVLQRSRKIPVVVVFWAKWCGPCKTLCPQLEKAAIDANGTFDLVKVEVDQNQELAKHLEVQSIPTVIAFRDGTPVSRFSGAIAERALSHWLEKILPNHLDLEVDRGRSAALDGNLLEAEKIFRSVLDESSDHHEGGTSLASLLLARGDHEDAMITLGKLPATPEVERLQATARVIAGRTNDLGPLQQRVDDDPDDGSARIRLANALAGRSEFEPALDHLLAVVRMKGEQKQAASKAMLDIFDVLGDDHPLTITYRRQLASALF